MKFILSQFKLYFSRFNNRFLKENRVKTRGREILVGFSSFCQEKATSASQRGYKRGTEWHGEYIAYRVGKSAGVDRELALVLMPHYFF